MDKKNIVACSQCKKEIIVFNSRLHKKNHFCDRDCYLKFHKSGFTINCVTCGNELYLPKYREGKKNYYCSFKCRRTAQEYTCDWCGIKFKRRGKNINDKNFCSKKCMGKWQSEYKQGENSNSWLGGWKKYYGANWTQQKNLARKRDNFTCQLCGGKELNKAFDVHHKIPFRKYGKEKYKEANRLDNLITLCNSCHSKIEPRKKLK